MLSPQYHKHCHLSVAKSSDEKSCLLANTTTKFCHYQVQFREELMLSCCCRTAGKSTRIWNETLAESDLSDRI
ncbi:hypothetical protein EB796_009390 [Bugula neritina]|uniref:Uncharacterized protein n=1 Tax=Bugula neritina TaxID=10212 RepID=A0A7J7K0X7_BUGNE|nr:hypothetical protein EB796_009390 [Bugula neritina]